MSKLPNSNNDTKDQPPSTPRWVKVTGGIALALIVLFLILHLTGIVGKPGPGRHIPGAQPTEQYVYNVQTHTEKHEQKSNNYNDGDQ